MESSYISDILPQRVRYSVFGYRSAAWNLGFSLSSFVAGGVIVRYGYGPSFAAYAVAMTAAMGLYYGYFRRISEVRLVEPPAPEPILESDAPESLTLRPGRGEPVIIVATRPEEPAEEERATLPAAGQRDEDEPQSE
jgi:MFS family permease